MNQFTWVEAYKEIASKVKGYKDRQEELINILADLQKRGLPTISLIDKNEKNAEIPLTVIDPFTFFGNFNRGIKSENRIEILGILKKLWGLIFSIPTDFDGIPVVNNQQAWFFSYKRKRGDRDIDLLWELFGQALDNNISPQTFDDVLKVRCVSYNITMGLFWINPDQFLNLDSVNRKYLAKNGITVTGMPDYQTYVEFMQETKSKLQKPFYEISHDAWLKSNEAVTTEQVRPDATSAPRYWLYAPGEQARFWEQYSQEGLMGIGWKELKEDLSEYKTDVSLREKLVDVYGEKLTDVDFRQLRDFLYKVRKGDRVFVKQGTKKLVGYGEVTSDYFYDPQEPEYRHLRQAEWQKIGNWSISDGMKVLPMKTLTELDDPDRIRQLLALIDGKPERPENQMPDAGETSHDNEYTLDNCAEETGFAKWRINTWKAAIERKKQAIFFGPPGTGKTFLAENLARHIVGGTDGIVDFIQFHPAYTYEEFMQGIRPEVAEKGNLQFVLKPGRFLEFCARAEKRKGPCVLIIDEINRANLARVFGELMYLLEYRDRDIALAGGSVFSIPGNVRIIGTMNTADRSIALVDFALRRRFAFLELEPAYDVLLAYQSRRNFNAEGLVRILRDVNSAIDDKNFHLGISFFMTNNLSEKLEAIWKMEIEPYLEEYFFSQTEAMAGFRWDRIKERLHS